MGPAFLQLYLFDFPWLKSKTAGECETHLTFNKGVLSLIWELQTISIGLTSQLFILTSN